MPKLIDEEWPVVVSLLPTGWRILARETGAIQRRRGAAADPDVLMRLLLLHVAGGLSLVQAVARARLQGIAKISDSGLLQRLRSSEAWLSELARLMFVGGRFTHDLACAPPRRRLRAVDATTVQEPGATGTDWRVHYAVDLRDMSCDFFEVTDATGAETWTRIPVEAGDILLGDRVYCTRGGADYVLSHGGDLVMRLHSTNFPLIDLEGDEAFDLLGHLRTLGAGDCGDWPVRFRAKERIWHARVCARRRSVEAAERAKKNLRAAASKRQSGDVRETTLEFAEYIFVITTLAADAVNGEAVLDLYRARWQIELCFKRLKSLMRLGHLPKSTDGSSRAWIQGKLLSAQLVEALADRARFFSPWGYDLGTPKPMA